MKQKLSICDSMQCGVACLQMVSKYLGREYSLHFLSNIYFATSEGVSMLGISEAANGIVLHSVCTRVMVEELSKVSLPCILYWNQNHFVVLYKVKREKSFISRILGRGL